MDERMISTALAAELSPELAARLTRELRESGDSVAALGQAYEQSLDRGRRRSAGIYYTPPTLAREVVDLTLAPLLRRRRARDLLELRIVDLSCGGGVFLAAAARAVIDHAIAGDRGGVAALGGAERFARRVVSEVVLGFDVDAQAARLARLALAVEIGGQPGDLAASADSIRELDSLLDPLAVERVDAVVGNPPWGQKGFSVTPAAKATLRQRFRVARGPLDPFKLFVELAHQLMAPGARWGLVLPDIVLLKDHERVRRLMLEQSELELIAELGRVFDGVNLDAVTIVGTRVTAPRPGHRVMTRRYRDGDTEASSQAQAVFAELPGAKLNLHLDGESLALYRKLRALPKLGERFEIHEGVHSGNCRAKLFRADRPPGRAAPLVLGKGELSPFRLRWGGGWLALGAIDRAAGDYANLGQARWHQSPKLVVRRTGDRVIAARDPDGLYVSNNLFVVVPRDPDEDLLAHLAILGSSLHTWYFRTEQPRVGRLFAELKICHLREFPLPAPPAYRRHRARLAELARALECETSPAALAELDAAVADAFELGDADRQQVSRCRRLENRATMAPQ